VLSYGEPRNAAVNFDMYRILQRHRAVSLPKHGFLVYISHDQRPFKCWNYTQYAGFHGRDAKYGDSRKSRHTTKSNDDREYAIILLYNAIICYNKCSCLYVG